MFAYHLIEIVERLNAATRRCAEPIIAMPDLPTAIRSEAQSLIDQADLMMHQTIETVSLDCLFMGVSDLRAKVEKLMANLRQT